MQFVLDGVTGPASRLVSSFTFALQHQHWPDNPFQFKLVNLFIHLINGCLVYFLTRFIFKKIQPANIKSMILEAQSFKQADLFAFIVTALWLLHPMQTTTVLYTVQRMTQLSAFFTLLGLAGYLIYREFYVNGDAIKGLLGMSLFVSVATICGVLSKENGILLPLYILIVEAILYVSAQRTKVFKRWFGFFVIFPLLLVVAYLLVNFESHLAGYSYRPFSMGERLLTQPVILVHYLSDILLPQLKVFTLYHDDFPISRGLLDPPSTLYSLLTCGGLLIIGIKKIRAWPVFSFGILWFFAGHMLESSHIGLELYFEHRNYLSSLGIFVLVVWLLFKATNIVNKKMIFSIAAIYFSLLILTTWSQMKIWADPLGQAMVWQKAHPESIRAITNLVNMNLKYGHIEEAKKVHGLLSEQLTGDASLFLKDISIAYCIEEKPLSDEYWDELLVKAQMAKTSGSFALMEMNNLLINIEKGYCLPAHIPRFALLAVVLAANPEFKGFKGQLHQIAAFMLVQAGDVPTALANVDEALKFKKTPTRFVLKFQLLIVQKKWVEAEQVLVEFKSYLKQNKKKYLAYNEILNDLTTELNDHVNSSN